MILIISGSRTASSPSKVWDILDRALTYANASNQPLFLSLGDAQGVDTYALEWCKHHPEATFILHVAQWNKYGKRAGYLRNIDMINTALAQQGGSAQQASGSERETYCLLMTDKPLAESKGTHMMKQLVSDRNIPFRHYFV